MNTTVTLISKIITSFSYSLVMQVLFSGKTWFSWDVRSKVKDQLDAPQNKFWPSSSSCKLRSWQARKETFSIIEFNYWVSKAFWDRFVFALPLLYDWFRKLAPLYQPIKCKTKLNNTMVNLVFLFHSVYLLCTCSFHSPLMICPSVLISFQ